MLWIHIYPEKKRKHFSKLPPVSQKTRFPIHPVICIKGFKEINSDRQLNPGIRIHKILPDRFETFGTA